MLRVLAVDDEKPALEELLYLLRSDPRIRSAEGATDATEALRRISRALDAGPDGEDGIDVVFLDIHMAGLTGLDVARLLAGFARPPLIVFVTAHEGFAVQAFDLKAVDYVLKPVRRERLAEAVRRVRDLVVSARETRQPEQPVGSAAPAPVLHTAPAVAPPGAPPANAVGAEQIPVELGGVTRFVPIDDIAYAEAQGDYARLHTKDGSHLVRIPLSTLEERWASRGFVRIHRSHLVALARIDELRLDAGATTVRVGAAELAVSRRHARQLRDLLMRHARG
ncbi:response regulator transcription factor [Streptomyces lunaelactis]|uniref:LytR/AlgR family response regulator transcription factor n=4 Tax=Streptomyces lunaelactis TaxID=1535768 RepID=UPI001584C62A|nr:LytTR family DNA-binding domain-containing protein [Streptomyces lunaelactis]NUJ99540.1 response regulator transcription factor [Streptomyces lunaelactis]NUK14264.1 response regulator transcription factor [Streptomyces lunaelactis]NUK32919.1 response regulator transcription factor [Streptomyces lunaelactis]NUK40259.1 response regulator transcription factor [Streptomyces lunaelactis]NUK90575.1 response regulator transcription factor [Streptomyces lunaelactis]